ncbi:MAG: type I 3-dehydroquinate dehydratase [Akkermansiaceae bacterium]|nr:type I 3-dehydroquinate dehydratase [Akkermansiaceae bacterium]
MSQQQVSFGVGRRWVVGSIGEARALAAATAAEAITACDLVEIRLDALAAEGGGVGAGCWRHLEGLPLLFTARRGDEGGARETSPGQRMELLYAALDDAAVIDVEVASISEMSGLLAEAARRSVPWIGSFHDFEKLPGPLALAAAAARARDAGAAVFKVAAMLHHPADIARLAEFQASSQGVPLATMGMGPLAPVSRLLCAQYGSVLNYGYLGETPTAPGQWECGLLRQAIRRLAPVPGGGSARANFRF